MTQPVRLPQDTALLVLVDDAAALRDQPLSGLMAAWRAADMPRLVLAGPNAALASGAPDGESAQMPADMTVLRHSMPSAFADTALDARLTAAGITTVVVAAQVAPESLAATLADAASLGLRVVVADECATGIDAQLFAASARLAPAAAIVAGVGLLAARKRPWPTTPAKTF